MSTFDASACSSHHVGHIPHFIQVQLALQNPDPRPLQVLEVSDAGLVVADDTEVRRWRVHPIGRDIVRRQLADGVTHVTDHGHHCALVGGRPISYAEAGDLWRDCHVRAGATGFTDHLRILGPTVFDL